MMHFLCIKWGNKYSAEYVNNLRKIRKTIWFSRLRALRGRTKVDIAEKIVPTTSEKPAMKIVILRKMSMDGL